jgi:hypothetical protein
MNDKTGPQWDPEVADAFMGELITPQVLDWAAQTVAVYVARQEIEEKVRERIGRAQTLKCERNETVPDAYHVSGGQDPNGHTVDLLRPHDEPPLLQAPAPRVFGAWSIHRRHVAQ